MTYSARCDINPTHTTHSTISRSSGKVLYTLANYVTCANFSSTQRAFLAKIDAQSEPASFSEAVKDAEWHAAMNTEIQALEDNKTWSLVHLPPGKKAIGSKWSYRIK